MSMYMPLNTLQTCTHWNVFNWMNTLSWMYSSMYSIIALLNTLSWIHSRQGMRACLHLPTYLHAPRQVWNERYVSSTCMRIQRAWPGPLVWWCDMCMMMWQRVWTGHQAKPRRGCGLSWRPRTIEPVPWRSWSSWAAISSWASIITPTYHWACSVA